jgi:hypothetical protein
VSKFGGFRFVATDADGRLYVTRQRRIDPDADGATPPYLAPIYGQYDGSGHVSLSGYSTTADDPPPPGMSRNDWQTLHVQLYYTAGDLSRAYATFNILLNALVALGTDQTCASDRAWLGDGFQAAYAPSRSSWDSSHIAVTRAQSGGEPPNTYAAYQTVCDPITKAWHQRLIAQQTTPADPGQNESGDHYQATIAGANAYGRAVSLASTENANLLIEVRADTPTTVTDDTHNLYYDIDRHTSFTAVPDQATGRLEVVVKAETFAQVLYVRLVDTSGLQPSGGDTAMLASSGATIFPWQTVNMAAQAQQRMGNDGTATIVDLLGDDAPLVDTTQYISGPQLYDGGGAGGWSFKTGFGPPSNANDANLASLATYLNTSGQNLIAAAPQLGLGASDDGTIDPLTAVTAVTADTLVASAVGTTTFTFPAGSIGHDTSATGGGEPGSISSGISHALHDALQRLQHVEADVYKDLSQGAVAVEMAADSIKCTVTADIMEAVSGVDEALTEVVSTVEEYANVLVNLVVTIVEQSFLFRMIEELIALILLFIHLHDVLALNTSMQHMMCNILDGTSCPDDRYASFAPPSVDDSYSTWDIVGTYFGADSSVSGDFTPDNGALGSGLATGFLDAISSNPFTRKILNALMTAVGDAVNAAASELPLQFNSTASRQQPTRWVRAWVT